MNPRSLVLRFCARGAVVTVAMMMGLRAYADVPDAASREKGGLVPFAAGGATRKADAPRRFGLFVGVGDFGRSGFPALRFADKDARDFAAAIESLDHAEILTTPAQTTRSAILGALRQLARRANRALDTVIVYISGHGALARLPGRPLRRYVVTSDAQRQQLAGLRARRKAVIFAFCHSGAGKSVMTDDLASALWGMKGPFVPPPLEDVSEGTAVLSASAFGETAREDDRLQGDVYTHFLIEGIRNGDLDGDGAVTLSEAHDYARTRTYAATGGAQRPTAIFSLVGADPLVLAGVQRRRPRPVLFSYAASAEGLFVAVDGRVKGALPGSIVVEPGPRRVELRVGEAGAVVYAGEMNVREGERLDVVALIPRVSGPRLSLRTGVLSALDAGGRGTVAPASLSLGIEASLPLRRLPRFRLALTFDFARGSGDAQGPSGLRATYSTSALTLGGALLAQAAWGRFRVEGGPFAGASYLRRGFGAGDVGQDGASDQGLGLTLGGRAGAGIDLGAHLGLDAVVELGALLIGVGGGTRATPVVRALAALSVRF